VDEYWVCQKCRSLNRAGSGRCYSCREKLGSRPSPDSNTSVSAAPPPPAAGPEVSFSAAPVQASYYSRSVGLTASTVPAAEAARRSRGMHLPHPVAAVRRRIASSLAMRKSVSVAPLGYVTAALLTLVIPIYVVTILAVMPAASYLLQHANPQDAWTQLSAGQQSTLEIVSIVLAAFGLVALVAFSVFVGLSTHNATGLGAGQPILTPYRAGTCWAGMLRAQALIGVGPIVPAALIWRGYPIPGLIVALVGVEWAHRRIEDPVGWLTRPARHLPDLYAKLGVDGLTSSRLGTIWSVSFRLANLAAMAVSALPFLALLAFATLVVAKRNEVIWQSTGLGPIQIAVAVFVGCLAGLTVVTVALLIPMTIGLVRRQQTRRTLVRVGRSRSWVARPGEGAYAPAPATPTARYDPNEDEDRIVERRPTFASGPLGDPGQANPAKEARLGGEGFGDDSARQAFGGPTGEDPDQASLNSPSTTSSFPWSDDSPDSPG